MLSFSFEAYNTSTKTFFDCARRFRFVEITRNYEETQVSKIGRRTFMQVSAAATAGALLHTSRDAVAQDAEKLDPADPTAQAFKYVHDAAEVDPADFLQPQAEQNCANCMLIQGNEGDEWRPCPIFQMKLVASAGWCTAWAAKQ